MDDEKDNFPILFQILMSVNRLEQQQYKELKRLNKTIRDTANGVVLFVASCFIFTFILMITIAAYK